LFIGVDKLELVCDGRFATGAATSTFVMAIALAVCVAVVIAIIVLVGVDGSVLIIL
jgi:hypothetical protein